VCVDDCKGAQLAVEHLLQLGHRSIGYLGVSSRPRSNQQRLLGYQNALEAYGVLYRDTWVAVCPLGMTTASDEMSLEEDVIIGQTLLPLLLNAGVTAIFCYNDMIAIGVLMACREQGIAVPQQLSVIGFDDINMASYVTPPLTTIHQPKVELGCLAAQVLLDLLNGRPGQNHLLSSTLVLRASTAQLDQQRCD
jgi:LacI family transcriptional regulator/LacI family repressor for deo operon, udp, cdd, tsx, nupC, and nupG